MSAFRAVIFDFFGTLTEAVQRGPRHARIARGLGCDPASMIDVLDRSFLDRARGTYGDAADTLRWVCAQAGARPSAAQLRAGLAGRLSAVAADTRLRADAVSTLRAVRALGLRTGVISDCGYELPRILPTLPVARLLDATVFSVQVGRCKPDPAIYLTACARLGVSPRECLYVGDGGSQELTGAGAVGMTAVRLAAPDLVNHLVFAADHDFLGRSVRSLGELLTLLAPSGVPVRAREPELALV